MRRYWVDAVKVIEEENLSHVSATPSMVDIEDILVTLVVGSHQHQLLNVVNSQFNLRTENYSQQQPGLVNSQYSGREGNHNGASASSPWSFKNQSTLYNSRAAD